MMGCNCSFSLWFFQSRKLKIQEKLGKVIRVYEKLLGVEEVEELRLPRATGLPQAS